MGCTILLSGNLLTELDELRKVKQALKEMLKLARNVILERQFLLQLNTQIPRAYLDESSSLNVAESPFLITRNISNRQTLVLSKVIMKKGIVSALQLGVGALTQNAQVNTSQQMNPQALARMELDDVSMHPVQENLNA